MWSKRILPSSLFSVCGSAATECGIFWFTVCTMPGEDTGNMADFHWFSLFFDLLEQARKQSSEGTIQSCMQLTFLLFAFSLGFLRTRDKPSCACASYEPFLCLWVVSPAEHLWGPAACQSPLHDPDKPKAPEDLQRYTGKTQHHSENPKCNHVQTSDCFSKHLSFAKTHLGEALGRLFLYQFDRKHQVWVRLHPGVSVPLLLKLENTRDLRGTMSSPRQMNWRPPRAASAALIVCVS